MAVSRVYLLYEGDGTVAEGDAITPDLLKGMPGTVQCQFTPGSGLSFKMEIQGRLRPDMNWGVVGVLDSTDLDSNDSAFISVKLLPNMRAVIISATAAIPADDIVAYLAT